MFTQLFLAACAVGYTLACADHSSTDSALHKRAGGSSDWAYEASYNWGKISDGK